MAGGARARLGGRAVRHPVGVRRMAARALERGAMLAGISSAHVPEVQRFPVRIAVAAGAIDMRAHVVRRDADRSDVVVAVGAACRERAVIELRGTPRERAVTGVALL